MKISAWGPRTKSKFGWNDVGTLWVQVTHLFWQEQLNETQSSVTPGKGQRRVLASRPPKSSRSPRTHVLFTKIDRTTLKRLLLVPRPSFLFSLLFCLVLFFDCPRTLILRLLF